MSPHTFSWGLEMFWTPGPEYFSLHISPPVGDRMQVSTLYYPDPTTEVDALKFRVWVNYLSSVPQVFFLHQLWEWDKGWQVKKITASCEPQSPDVDSVTFRSGVAWGVIVDQVISINIMGIVLFFVQILDQFDAVFLKPRFC